MQLLGLVLAVNMIVLTIFLLVKRCSPSVTLLVMGLIMLVLASVFDIGGVRSECDSSVVYFIFDKLYSAFRNRLAEAGLLIMLFGGYIEYMTKICASNEMIYLLMRPLSVLRNYPYLSALVVIPIGVLFYMVIPSATAMGLLLVATIYPVLLGLGLSRKSSLSIISVCTLFDVGMASLNSNVAADMLGINIVSYFSSQLSLLFPLMIVLVITVMITNYRYDKRENRTNGIKPYSVRIEELSGKAPVIYAVLPILPIIVLLLLPPGVSVLRRVSVAILISFVVAGITDSIYKKSLALGFREMNSFWNGMGKICATAVLFMVCADIFSMGLVRMAISDALVATLSNLDCGKFFSLLIIGTVTFVSSFLVGSGVSFFNSVADVIPDVALSLDVSPVALTMMIQLITGFARTASPIAVVVITVSQIAGISPMELVKRNLPPMAAVSLAMIVATLIIA